MTHSTIFHSVDGGRICSRFNVLSPLDVPVGWSCLDSSQCLGGYGVECKEVSADYKKCTCIAGYEPRASSHLNHVSARYDHLGYGYPPSSSLSNVACRRSMYFFHPFCGLLEIKSLKNVLFRRKRALVSCTQSSAFR